MLKIKYNLLLSKESKEKIEADIARQLEEHPQFLFIPKEIDVEIVTEKEEQ